MEHGASSEILPVEVMFEPPDVYLLDFDCFVTACQLLSKLLFFFGEPLLAQKGAGIIFYEIGFNEGTFRTLLRKFYY